MVFRCLVLVCSFFFTQSASAYYELTPKLKTAYSKIIELRLQEGAVLLEQERTAHPGNHLVVLYENYIDFLKAFITEEKEYFEIFKKKSSERVKMLGREEKEAHSPFHLYALAEMTMQDAMLKVKFQENISAATEIRTAYKLIHRNQLIFPTFLLNKKLDGFIHTLVGAVPQEYRWLVDLVGMEGTVPGGARELMSLYFMLDGSGLECYKPELLFYLSNIYNTFAHDEIESLELLTLIKPYTNQNPLLRYCYANTAMKIGRNEEALKSLVSLQSDKGSFPFYYMNYKMGLARLRKLDMSGEADLKYFLDNFKGINHKKSVNQKLAWIELLRGNKLKYQSYMKECLGSGNMNVDEDKDALHEASSGEVPNLILLRARLLFDGGYYKESWSEIAGKPIDSFPRFRDQLEVTYRLGRIMEKMNLTDKAIEYYSKTLKNGAASSFYFAANSALLLGAMYERKGKTELALDYYNRCLALRGHEYQNSIDQKAQAGIDRLKEIKKK